MVDILIIKVKVNKTRSGFATYIYKATPWDNQMGVGLDKANRTLQYTTQDNVRSSLKPMTWCYKTYLMSQRLHGLNCRFYTDTLFAEEKSIFGNTCARIFTDGNLFK